ncbi:MAG: hypothetical protein KDD70_13795, partial [Bdellovibrionales bacterium]|nr:hypothetical protein [Bdellovibrionales bacterium]
MKSHSSEIQSSEADLCAVISSLEPAGAEFAFAALIGEAVRAGRRVQVITIRSPGETDLSLPQEVRRTSLHLNLREVSGLKKIFLFCRLFWRLRREFTKSSSHTLLSFMTQTNVVALLCSFGCFQRRVVCERTHPEYAPFLGKPPLRGILRLVRNLVYSIADTVIVQSPSMVQCFPSRLHPKIKVIPNFLRDFALGFDVRVPREKTVLSVGRLVESKDHLIAIRVFARAS